MSHIVQYVEDDGCYGECYFPDVVARVNLSRIWWETQELNSFITLYSDTVLHEVLHKLINNILFDLRISKEEKIVRLLTGEEEHSCTPKRMFQVVG